jgi:hypothetical protein
MSAPDGSATGCIDPGRPCSSPFVCREKDGKAVHWAIKPGCILTSDDPQLASEATSIVGTSGNQAVVFLPDAPAPPDENTLSSADKMAAFRMNNNIIMGSKYGFFASGMAGNLDTIAKVFFEDPAASLQYNVVQSTNGDVATYASYGMDKLDDPADIGFVDLAGGDDRLSASSTYAGTGANGADYGADIDAVAAATGADL